VHDKLGPDARFTDNDLRIAEAFASRAAVAVDLSQRIARDALRRIVNAQELERRRLARELHDETGQALSSILLGLKALDEKVESDDARQAVSNVRELVVATLRDVRRLAIELRPKVLDDFGLVPALERLAETFGGQTGNWRTLRVRPRRRAPPRRGGDRSLSHRSGVSHEHRQALACAQHQHRARPQAQRSRSSNRR